MTAPAPIAATARGVDRARELAYTSYLRVLAIVGVVFIHVAGLSFTRDDLAGGPAWWLGGAMAYGSRWAVIVFVMVSGALLLQAPADPDIGRFYRRRLARVGIPLLFWHAVYIPLSAVRWDSSPAELLAAFLEGRSYTALYFFWLILGLYAITPLLWPLSSALSARTVAVAGGALAAVPALDVVLRGLIAVLREEARVLPEPTLVTQFLPYVGFFVLGFALRDLVLRGVRLVVVALGLVALLVQMVVQAAQSPNLTPQGDGMVNALLPLSYQGAAVGLSAVAVFVLARSVAHPESHLAAPEAARPVLAVADLTFGVFACHLLVLHLIAQIPWLEVEEGASSVAGVLALVAAVVAISFALSWFMARTPVLRRAV